MPISALTQDNFQPRHVLNRSGRGRLLFLEDGRHPVLGMWNDGKGVAWRDSEVTFMGLPTIRLDPQGVISGNTTTPGTIDTNGVVFKRRVSDPFSGVFAVEVWIRWLSSTAHTSTHTVVSNYNRDGTNAYHARLWLDTSTVGTMALWYLNSTGTWVNFANMQDQDHSRHNYSISGNLGDKAGHWWNIKLAADFVNKKYVYAAVNGVRFDLSANTLDTRTSTSQEIMHFSVEYSQYAAGNKQISLAQPAGYQE